MFDAKHVVLPVSSVIRSTRRPQYAREGLCVLAALAILSQLFMAYRYHSFSLQPWSSIPDPANTTLGFGGIYAVSRKGSPRRQSLMNAASLTNLDIAIPVQPTWTEKDIASIQAPENSTLDRGSALAWLGHRNAIESFLRTTHETALIIEDDVDWDVRLRQEQIPRAAYAIRELLGSQAGSYYGNTNDWDIIWLGHCGDYFNASRGSNLKSIKSFNDPAMPALDSLHPWTKDFMKEIGANQNRQRLVHQSVHPLCTFAYAITRAAASRVLNELTVSEPARDSKHPCRAYDVRLLEGCRDEGLRCITVNPELFHHSPGSSEIAQAVHNSDSAETSQSQDVESPTTNIRCSARSRKWKEIQEGITDPSVDAESFVRDLAELSSHCHIDDL